MDQQDIIATVEVHGYCCSTKYNKSIPRLKVLELPLYIDLYTYDRENMDDIHVDGLSDEQEPWVARLKFKYRPTDDDRWGRITEWGHADRDDPIRSQGMKTIYVYYMQGACPPEGSTFEGIDEDGGIERYHVENGNLYCGHEWFNSIDNWDKCNILTLTSK